LVQLNKKKLYLFPLTRRKKLREVGKIVSKPGGEK